MRVRPMQVVAGAGAAALLAVASGCGSGAGMDAASTSAASKTRAPATDGTKQTSGAVGSTTAAPATGGEITIKDFAFHPASSTAKVGQAITVKNDDSTAHTVTADNGAFDTKPIPAGGSATFTVTSAGAYPFHCAIHEFMKGTLTIG